MDVTRRWIPYAWRLGSNVTLRHHLFGSIATYTKHD